MLTHRHLNCLTVYSYSSQDGAVRQSKLAPANHRAGFKAPNWYLASLRINWNLELLSCIGCHRGNFSVLIDIKWRFLNFAKMALMTPDILLAFQIFLTDPPRNTEPNSLSSSHRSGKTHLAVIMLIILLWIISGNAKNFLISKKAKRDQKCFEKHLNI